MLGKLLPILLAFLGVGAGIGAGLALRSPPEEALAAEACVPTQSEVALETPPQDAAGEDATYDYVKLNNQFVIPVVEEARVAALVVISLSVEVAAGQSELVFKREPKLRDAFLQVMFDHANSGGFNGAFTNGNSMLILRDALREVARKTLGKTVTDVLIIDLVRQDT